MPYIFKILYLSLFISYIHAKENIIYLYLREIRRKSKWKYENHIKLFCLRQQEDVISELHADYNEFDDLLDDLCIFLSVYMWYICLKLSYKYKIEATIQVNAYNNFTIFASIFQ